MYKITANNIVLAKCGVEVIIEISACLAAAIFPFRSIFKFTSWKKISSSLGRN